MFVKLQFSTVFFQIKTLKFALTTLYKASHCKLESFLNDINYYLGPLKTDNRTKLVICGAFKNDLQDNSSAKKTDCIMYWLNGIKTQNFQNLIMIFRTKLSL